MPTNLTGQTIASSYDQLLHVDDGPTAGEKIVYSGVGVATALSIGTGSASVDNIKFDGNTISTLDTNGNLVLAPNGTGVVTTDNISLSGNTITATNTNGNLVLSGNGTGSVSIANATITGGAISGVTFTGSFTGLTLIESTTLATSAAAAGCNLSGSTLAADGTDTNININITPKGTGQTLSSGKMGYPTGTGGSVTQATSRTTGVTLDKITGEIILVAGTLGGHDADEFVLTNSTIEANDVFILGIKSGVAAGTRKYYQVHVVSVSAGSCVISVGNIDNATIPASGTDAPVIQFVVLKGAVA